jgi:hypothetical protein
LQTLENEEQHYSKYYRNKLNISWLIEM